MPSAKIEFPGHSGATLAARLDRPAGPARASAIFAHCFTCSKDLGAVRRIAARLAEAGIAVLRFDFTGLGHSEGEFANTHFSSNVDDLVAAARFLERRGEAPALLIGHSLGGAAVIAAADQLPSVRAVATIGAPFDPAHVLHQFDDRLEDISRDGEAEVTLAGRSFTISDRFVQDVASSNLEQALAGLKRPLLILHAPRDETVGVESASRIFMAAKHPKSFVSLDGADHLLSRNEDAEFAADVIAGWAGRYVGQTGSIAPPRPDSSVVRVVEADPDGFRQDVLAGPRHRLTADEPAEIGGSDLGPTPYDLVAAGLGACTSMTIRMYARRKGWPLEQVSVDVSHDRIHAKDCEDCETKDGRIDRFRRVITLDGALDDAQLTRLMEIADRCPVHRTLENEIVIETSRA